MAQLVDCRHVKMKLVGSNPVNFSLFQLQISQNVTIYFLKKHIVWLCNLGDVFMVLDNHLKLPVWKKRSVIKNKLILKN